jgi:hypothetical protein
MVGYVCVPSKFSMPHLSLPTDIYTDDTRMDFPHPVDLIKALPSQMTTGFGDDAEYGSNWQPGDPISAAGSRLSYPPPSQLHLHFAAHEFTTAAGHHSPTPRPLADATINIPRGPMPSLQARDTPDGAHMLSQSSTAKVPGKRGRKPGEPQGRTWFHEQSRHIIT